jgi:HK97 family phage portal protein
MWRRFRAEWNEDVDRSRVSAAKWIVGLRKSEREDMKILGWNIERDSPEPPQAAPVRRSATGLVWGDVESRSSVVTSPFEQVAWVYRAVNAIAEAVANVPFRFSRRAEPETVISNGPLTVFYEQPHPRLNQFQYWELRVIWLLLRGECFRVPQFGRNGKLEKLLMLDPAKFQHIVRDGELVGWKYQDYDPQGALRSQVLLPEEVIHDRLPNPFNYWRGLAPLRLATAAGEADYAAGQLLKGLWENNGEPGLIIRTDEQLDAEQREQMLAACAERKRRAGRADRPLLLWGGAEVVVPTLKSADSDFLLSRRHSVAEICAAFGVPEEIITSTMNTKHDVMAGARLNFIENRILPFCKRLEAEERRVVRLIDPEAIGWFDIADHPVMTEARKGRLEAARAGFEMGVPFNELNENYDLGFPKLPWGNRGYVPNRLVKVGEQVGGGDR